MQSIPTQENELKESIVSLKDSGVDYLKSKAELATIESKEAASFAKKKLYLAVMTAFFGLFSYALLLILTHSLLLKFGTSVFNSIQAIVPLSGSQVILICMFLFHLLFLLVYLVKLSKGPKEELFALTKSEFKKDQVWLEEMNKNAN